MLRKWHSTLTLLTPQANQRRVGSLLLLSQCQGSKVLPRRYSYRQVRYSRCGMLHCCSMLCILATLARLPRSISLLPIQSGSTLLHSSY